MERKRNKLEIIRDILRVISEKNGKIKPTHILYKSNLSYQMMEEYMKELIAKDFVREAKTKTGSKTYIITDKGLEYLRQYNMILDFTSSFGLN